MVQYENVCIKSILRISHRITESVDMLVAMEEVGITKFSRICLLGTMNVCTKFHCNPSNYFQDISVWTKVD